MEQMSTIERLRQTLESEEGSEALTVMPAETYIKLAGYAQKLRATTGSNTNDAPGRLAKKQLWLMEGMISRVPHLRLAKRAKREAIIQHDHQPPRPSRNLLPGERSLNDLLQHLPKKQEK